MAAHADEMRTDGPQAVSEDDRSTMAGFPYIATEGHGGEDLAAEVATDADPNDGVFWGGQHHAVLPQPPVVGNLNGGDAEQVIYDTLEHNLATAAGSATAKAVGKGDSLAAGSASQIQREVPVIYSFDLVPAMMHLGKVRRGDRNEFRSNIYGLPGPCHFYMKAAEVSDIVFGAFVVMCMDYLKKNPKEREHQFGAVQDPRQKTKLNVAIVTALLITMHIESRAHCREVGATSFTSAEGWAWQVERSQKHACVGVLLWYISNQTCVLSLDAVLGAKDLSLVERHNMMMTLQSVQILMFAMSHAFRYLEFHVWAMIRFWQLSDRARLAMAYYGVSAVTKHGGRAARDIMMENKIKKVNELVLINGRTNGKGSAAMAASVALMPKHDAVQKSTRRRPTDTLSSTATLGLSDDVAPLVELFLSLRVFAIGKLPVTTNGDDVAEGDLTSLTGEPLSEHSVTGLKEARRRVSVLGAAELSGVAGPSYSSTSAKLPLLAEDPAALRKREQLKVRPTNRADMEEAVDPILGKPLYNKTFLKGQLARHRDDVNFPPNRPGNLPGGVRTGSSKASSIPPSGHGKKWTPHDGAPPRHGLEHASWTSAKLMDELADVRSKDGTYHAAEVTSDLKMPDSGWLMDSFVTGAAGGGVAVTTTNKQWGVGMARAVEDPRNASGLTRATPATKAAVCHNAELMVRHARL